jgi:hypothetical protein
MKSRPCYRALKGAIVVSTAVDKDTSKYSAGLLHTKKCGVCFLVDKRKTGFVKKLIIAFF